MKLGGMGFGSFLRLAISRGYSIINLDALYAHVENVEVYREIKSIHLNM